MGVELKTGLKRLPAWSPQADAIAPTKRLEKSAPAFDLSPVQIGTHRVDAPTEVTALSAAEQAALHHAAAGLAQLADQHLLLIGADRAVAQAALGKKPSPEDEAAAQQVWREIVRDPDGRYAELAGRRFFPGPQPAIDLDDVGSRDYLQHSVRCREAFLATWDGAGPPRDLADYKRWLTELHTLQAYKGKPGRLRDFDIPAISFGGIGARLDALAVSIGDRQVTESSATGVDTPAARQFYRSLFNYPPAQRADAHLAASQHALLEVHAGCDSQPIGEQLSRLSDFLYYGIRGHTFETVNLSLLMNMVNGVLGQRGLKGIEHGVLDFAAFGLSAKGFARYFQNEVARANPGLVEPAALPTTAELLKEAGGAKKVLEDVRRLISTSSRELDALKRQLRIAGATPSERFESSAEILKRLSDPLDQIQRKILELQIFEAAAGRSPAPRGFLSDIQRARSTLEKAKARGLELNARAFQEPETVLKDVKDALREQTRETLARITSGDTTVTLFDDARRVQQNMDRAQALTANLNFLGWVTKNQTMCSCASQTADYVRRELDPDWTLYNFIDAHVAAQTHRQPVTPRA